MHAICTPEFDIVGIVMWFFYHSLVARIPGLNTIIHTRFYHGVHFLQPFIVTADAPFPIHLHNPTKLSICCRMKVMRCRLYRQYRPKVLVSGFVLAFTKFCMPQTSFQGRKQVWNCLCIIPNMRAGTMATTPVISAPFEAP